NMSTKRASRASCGRMTLIASSCLGGSSSAYRARYTSAIPPRAIKPVSLYFPNGTGSAGVPGCILPSVEARSVILTPPNLPLDHHALARGDLDEPLDRRIRPAVVLEEQAHGVAVRRHHHADLRLIDAEIEHRAWCAARIFDRDAPERLLQLVDNHAPVEGEL